MAQTNIDYTKIFVYCKLTPLTRQPSYEALKQLKDELKANAASVPSDLGGGLHGHLFLVLAAGEWVIVSATPFVRPGQPPALFIPAGTAHYMRGELCEAHKEEVRVLCEVHNVEATLKKQMVEAIPEMYIKGFINRHTNTLTAPIPTILQHQYMGEF